MALMNFVNQQQEQWLITDGGGGSQYVPGDLKLTPGTTLVANYSPQHPYEDPYVYRALGALAFTPTLFAYALKVKFPTQTDIDNCQAFEFEMQYQDGTYIANMAWQADFKGSGKWRTFDYNLKQWQPTPFILPVSTQWIAGLQIGVAFKFATATLLSGPKVEHVGINVNNSNWQPLNLWRPATKKPDNTPKFNLAWQLDGTQNPKPFSVELSAAEVMVI